MSRPSGAPLAALVAFLLLGLGVLAGCTPSTAPEDPDGSSTESGGPVAPGSAGTVYLTFDDGPGPFTQQVLEILRRTDSTATFFQLGMNRPGFEDVTAAIEQQGSKIGSHSYGHINLTEVDAAELESQISRGPKAKCFRPPYGASNAAVQSVVTKAGMREVLWHVDTQDWTEPGVEALVAVGANPEIKNDTIVLMHDGGDSRQQTVDALPTIIAELQARGFLIRALPYC